MCETTKRMQYKKKVDDLSGKLCSTIAVVVDKN